LFLQLTHHQLRQEGLPLNFIMRRRSLYTGIFVILIILIFISFFTVYLSLNEHKRDLIEKAIEEKIHLAETVNEMINSPFWAYRVAIIPGMETYFIETIARFPDIEYLRVVNIDGRILESSIEEERGEMLKEPGILKVLESKEPLIKNTNFGKKKIKLIIYPGYSQRTIWVGFNLKRVEDTIKGMWFRDAMIFTFSFLIIFLILFIFLREHIISPLKELTTLCQKVRKGDFKVRTKIQSKTEIGELAQSFNAMTKDLSEYRSALEEKTKELQKRVEELERFHRVTVGRELKMVELKKEIAKLKKELKECKKANITNQ